MKDLHNFPNQPSVSRDSEFCLESEKYHFYEDSQNNPVEPRCIQLTQISPLGLGSVALQLAAHWSEMLLNLEVHVIPFCVAIK